MSYKITDTIIVDNNKNIASIGTALFAGPVIIGGGTSTGTVSQPLQVTGTNGAYIGGNLGIGSINPTSKLWVNGDIYGAGIVTAYTLNASKDPGTGIATDFTNSLFGNGWRVSSPGSTTYYKLATLPPGGGGNTFDHLIITGVLGAWTNGNQTPFEITFSNRGSFNYKYVSYGSVRSDVRIIGISTNSSVEIWAQHQASQFTKLVYNIPNSIESIVVSNPTSTTTAPTGTTVFDSSTATPRFIINESDYVGIGTTNPLQKLHVLGNLLVAAGSSTEQHITQKAYELNSGTLSWEGSAGQLFSITNNLTSGSIFSVNDVSGIPSIDVNADGTVTIATYGGNIGIGTTNPTSKLQVSGNVSVSGVVTATTFVGALTGTATSTTNIPNLTGDITSSNTVTTLATVNSNVGTFGGTGAIPVVTVNGKGLVTGISTVAPNNGTLTLAVSGTGLSGSASFTANQSGASTFTVTSNATSANTVSAIVARDASGNFSAGTITASLTGTATSTTNIPNLTGAITSNNTTTSLGSFTSAQLATALTDETGSGANVFATSPVLVTPSLGIATATSINASGIITATQLSTGASGTGVNITTNTISGPATLTIDPAGVGDNTGAVRIKGDLYVDGTQFIVNSTTIELADFNVGIATTVGTNALLDGAGIGIGSTGIRKTITWSNSASALTSSEDWNLVTGKQYEINGTSVLSSTTLGSGVVNSSLTSVGTLASLTVTGAITANGGINLGDNDSANFGDSNDLRIYHNGGDSSIDDQGTGNLQLITNGSAIRFLKAGGETLANFNTDGAVELYYDNSKKVETTASGISVTGNIILTGDSIGMGNDSAILFFNDSTSQTRTGYWTNKDGFEVRGDGNNKSGVVLQTGNLEIDQNAYIAGILGIGGGLTGTASQLLQVDGGAYVSGNLGIGTTNPTSKLQVVGDTRVSGVVTAFDFYNDAEYPSVRPTLDLAFAQTKILDSRITFTRASTATYVNASGLIASAAVNEARFDHNPTTGESLGLLVEEARTNLVLQSEDFSDSITWVRTNSSVTANAATAPDGTTTADKLIVNSGTTSSAARITQTVVKAASAITYTHTIFAKTGESGTGTLQIIFTDTATTANSATSSFSTVSGTIATAASAQGTFTNASSTITAFANGWYRCSLTVTTGTETSIQTRIYSRLPTTGNGTSGLLLWGAQLEAGAFATSYIPTTTATATRAADVASITGANFSSWYNQTEGTVFVDTASYGSRSGANNVGIVVASDGSSSNFVGILANAAASPNPIVQPQIYSGGVPQVLMSLADDAINTKSAMCYATNNVFAVLNNGNSSTDLSATMPSALDRLQIGDFPGTRLLNGTIKRFTYWPVRLPDAQLQTITL